MPNCIDPTLHGSYVAGAEVVLFDRQLNELAPAVMNWDADARLLDVPDILVALQKWPGRIKVTAPISSMPEMSCVFTKENKMLRLEFGRFFSQCKKDGSSRKVVKKYYPSVVDYYLEFFEKYRIL